MWLFDRGIFFFLLIFSPCISVCLVVCRHRITKQEYCLIQRKEYSITQCFGSIILGIIPPKQSCPGIFQRMKTVCRQCVAFFFFFKMMKMQKDTVHTIPLFPLRYALSESIILCWSMVSRGISSIRGKEKGVKEFRPWYLMGNKMTHWEKVKRT